MPYIIWNQESSCALTQSRYVTDMAEIRISLRIGRGLTVEVFNMSINITVNDYNAEMIIHALYCRLTTWYQHHAGTSSHCLRLTGYKFSCTSRQSSLGDPGDTRVHIWGKIVYLWAETCPLPAFCIISRFILCGAKQYGATSELNVQLAQV
jgi:hypothetical protein